MRKKIINISLILMLVACSDGFLEQAPNNAISTEKFNPELALTGVYDALQNGLYTGVAFQWQMGYSPIASNRYDSDQNFHGNLESGRGIDPSNRAFENFWRDLYRLIFRANLAINKSEVNEQFDQEQIDVFKAQAKFIRAYGYSQLAALFGSVPLHLDPDMTVLELKQVKKSSKEEIIKQVLKDLNEAIEVLPVNATKGRVTKGAALALKARVLLRQNDYPGVLEATNQIIGLDKYGLFGETSPGVFIDKAYKKLFEFENEGSEESIFDIEYVGPEMGEGNDFERNGSYRTARGGYMWFWATKYLIDQYENIDGTPVNTEEPYIESGDPRFDGRDKRFNATITYPGKLLYNGQVFGPGYPIYARATTGLVISKFVWETDDVSIAGNADSPLNFMLIRYADVLLMNAEAKIETGDIADNGPYSAIKTINRIRARGGLQPSTATTQEELRAAVRKERMIEFAGEGLYMFDIRRWGIADVEMERDVQRFNGKVTHERTFHPRLLEWAIPQYEIDNTEGLEQNPLWK